MNKLQKKMIKSNFKIDNIKNENKIKKGQSDVSKNQSAINKNEEKKNVSGISNIQQRILDMQKNNADKEKKKQENKPIILTNHFDKSFFEKMKLFHQPSQKISNTSNNNSPKNTDKEKDELNKNKNIENKSENGNNKNNIINNEEKKKEDSITNDQLASIKIGIHINDIRNKNNNNSDSFRTIPKKLNLKEIFQNMKIEQLSSKIKADKREEIIKIAQKKKEEEKLNNDHEFEQENRARGK